MSTKCQRNGMREKASSVTYVDGENWAATAKHDDGLGRRYLCYEVFGPMPLTIWGTGSLTGVLCSSDGGASWSKVEMRMSPIAWLRWGVQVRMWPPQVIKSVALEEGGRLSIYFINEDFDGPGDDIIYFRGRWNPLWRWWDVRAISLEEFVVGTLDNYVLR